MKEYWVTFLCAMASPTESGDVPIDYNNGHFIYGNGDQRPLKQAVIKLSIIAGLFIFIIISFIKD